MSRCSKVEPIVRKVLEEKPFTRDDDFLLVYHVFKEFLPDIAIYKFQDIMFNHKAYGLPYFESVRRTRQKLQSKCPELASSERVRKAREAEEPDYIEYALSQ